MPANYMELYVRDEGCQKNLQWFHRPLAEILKLLRARAPQINCDLAYTFDPQQDHTHHLRNALPLRTVSGLTWQM